LVGDRGHQQDFSGLVGLRRGEVLLQRLVTQALHPAEEIDLPRSGQADE